MLAHILIAVPEHQEDFEATRDIMLRAGKRIKQLSKHPTDIQFRIMTVDEKTLKGLLRLPPLQK